MMIVWFSPSKSSYTAYLERAAVHVFEAVNLAFTGRNYGAFAQNGARETTAGGRCSISMLHYCKFYSPATVSSRFSPAMGGTSSAPEIAFCANEVFGTDIDVLVWDTGMTDGACACIRWPRIVDGWGKPPFPNVFLATHSIFPVSSLILLGNAFWKQELYHHRAGLNPGRPVNIVYHGGGRNYGGRIEIVKRMEDIGLAALISNENALQEALDAVPDSFGLTDAQINQLPQFVRNFRCGTQIEAGDPYCQERKFNHTLCATRKFQTSWHPGWKWQGLMGNIAAFFLFDVLEDALKEIGSRSTVSGATLYTQLQALEDAGYEAFVNAPISDALINSLPEDDRAKFNFEHFFKGHVFCHTALLPAEIRHKGILTESTKTGFFDYDKGYAKSFALANANLEDTMLLVYDEDDRQVCPVPTNMDFKGTVLIFPKHVRFQRFFFKTYLHIL
jgi:hypothetical protein